MNKIVDYLTWGFIALFAAPTVLIMASWSSLPGTPMFGVKRTFEQGLLLAVRPSYETEASLNAQFTKRRMEEAKVLLAKNQSAEGLSYLSAQIKATRTMIQRAPTQEKKREAAKNYITTLQGVSKELKAQQTKSSRVAVKTAPRAGRTAGTSQQQLQQQLAQQLAEVEQMQAQLRSQLQQPQTQQLIAQLAQQQQQLQQLQSQLQQPQQQQQVAAALEQQIQQSETIQAQVDQVAPPVDDAVNTMQEEIDNTITDLETLSDTPPESITPTETPVPTVEPTAEPTEAPTSTPVDNSHNNNGNGNGNGDDDKK